MGGRLSGKIAAVTGASRGLGFRIAEALVAEELLAQPGAIIAPGFGDLAEGMARPSSPV